MGIDSGTGDVSGGSSAASVGRGYILRVALSSQAQGRLRLVGGTTCNGVRGARAVFQAAVREGRHFCASCGAAPAGGSPRVDGGQRCCARRSSAAI